MYPLTSPTTGCCGADCTWSCWWLPVSAEVRVEGRLGTWRQQGQCLVSILDMYPHRQGLYWSEGRLGTWRQQGQCLVSILDTYPHRQGLYWSEGRLGTWRQQGQCLVSILDMYPHRQGLYWGEGRLGTWRQQGQCQYPRYVPSQTGSVLE